MVLYLSFDLYNKADMKYRKFVILILFVLLFTCKKDDTVYCWKCQTVYYENFQGWTISTDDQIICNETKNYIYYFEQNHTFSDGHGNGQDLICTKIK
jgi:hypothetical protein